MGFNDLVVTLARKHSLPEMAALQLNDLLSEDAKKELLKRSPEEVADILNYAIRKINNGSTAKIDDLVKRLM